MMAELLDVIVIGGGPGGYVAALRAAQLGQKVLVVEKDAALGGACLHRGCIPTKALLHTAELLDQIAHAEELGFAVDGTARFDAERSKKHRRKVIAKSARGIEFLFRRSGVKLVRGFGRLRSASEVEVVDAEGAVVSYRAKYVILATGSVPTELPSLPTDGVRILNSDHILELDDVPESLVVVGGGAVGCEFASIYASLGSRVTLVELLPRLLLHEDEEASQAVQRAFKKRGIDVRLETQVGEASAVEGKAVEGGLELTLAGKGEGQTVMADRVLVAVGRTPVVDGMNLHEVGVGLDGRFVRVDQFMETQAGGVYAIGDLVKTPQLAHLASAEGVLAVEHLAGLEPRPIDLHRVPSCTYCDPEVASVGLTEAQAREKGYKVKVGKFPLSASGKAAILGKTEGFVKVVSEETYDELLGVHIVGAHATDLIAEACVALQVESTTEEIFRTMHAHPTLSEALAEAALAASGRGLHA